jgi:Tfp pilus assembly protein PilO
MNFSDKTLVKKLAIVLVLKLIVLLALWWFVVRENRVSIDERSAAEQLLSSAPSTEQRKKP